MIYSFSSHFAKQFNSMIEFKEALGYSRNSYCKFLLNFDSFCTSNFPNETSLTKMLVMEWGRMKPTENANGVKRRLIAIREFGKYLTSIGIDAYIVPSEMIGSFRPFTPYIFTDTELNEFFKATDCILSNKNSPLTEYTVPVLFRLLYCCGLRPNEIRNIKLCDINFKSGIILIRESKSHKDRMVITSEDILELCNKYNSLVNSIKSNREYFFETEKGEPYTANWIQVQFRKCWKIAGITSFHGSSPRVSDFRHNYATRILQKWLDEKRDIYTCIPYLSAYMGHANFTNTAYYIHLLPERLVETTTIDWKRFDMIIPGVKTL